MRIFKTCGDALNEIKRDLAEMGINVHPQTMQDKVVADDENYATKELQNYIYMVTNPLGSLNDLRPTQPWADAEFDERVGVTMVNPGSAYKLREDVWNEFLHDGQFSYTYSERMYHQIDAIINELKVHPDSRQLYMSIWDPVVDISKIGGKKRVPCSLGYQFQLRGGQLNMTYFMRSCDMATHMQNDIYLAIRLLEYIAAEANVKVGTFTHYIASLHVYQKDVEGVF